MHNSRLATATAFGFALMAFIAGCSREAPEPAAVADEGDAASTQEAAAPASSAATGHATEVYFGDTHLHTAHVDGRRRVRQPPRLRGRLPLRARRGGDVVDRPAGEALAPARLPGGRRPLRQHGLLPRPVRRQAGTCSPTRPARAGTTWCKAGEGNAAALEIIDEFSRGTFPRP